MKTVLITGGSSGIGAATAWLASQQGWNVVVGYHQGVDRAKTLIQKINSAHGQAQAMSFPLDNPAAIPSLVETMKAHVPELAAVILSASPAPQFESFLKISADRYRSFLDINVLSNHILLSELWKTYFDSTGGHVIGLLSSALGPPLKPQLTPYVVAKSAMKTMLDSALQELGSSGLRVTVVSPDFTETPMLSNFHPYVLQLAREKMPSKQFLDAAEVARIIVHALNHPPTEPIINSVAVPAHE